MLTGYYHIKFYSLTVSDGSLIIATIQDNTDLSTFSMILNNPITEFP